MGQPSTCDAPVLSSCYPWMPLISTEGEKGHNNLKCQSNGWLVFLSFLPSLSASIHPLTFPRASQHHLSHALMEPLRYHGLVYFHTASSLCILLLVSGRCSKSGPLEQSLECQSHILYIINDWQLSIPVFQAVDA